MSQSSGQTYAERYESPTPAEELLTPRSLPSGHTTELKRISLLQPRLKEMTPARLHDKTNRRRTKREEKGQSLNVAALV